MLIAAIDSTAVTASAAVIEVTDGAVSTYSLSTVKNKLTHSELLLPLLENALKAYGASINDIDLYAVSAGPGSFTGVRIGAATVKGLAFPDNKQIAAVSALEALAYNGGSGYVLAVMDARRDQFYNAIFKDGERISEDAALSYYEICEKIKDLPELTVVGDGAEKFISLYGDDKNIRLASRIAIDQNALSVGIIGYKKYEQGEIVTAKDLKPIYLRMPQAEREKLERENNK